MSKWYSVKEYEPCCGNQYLVPVCLGFQITTADYIDGAYYFMCSNGARLKNITHFMPIPPVPREG